MGQNLINAAEVRAQLTQIEKYNSAVNTFRGKFNAIPGDIAYTTAQQYGFVLGASCTGAAAQRDGNGLIDANAATPLEPSTGEAILFWSDITSSIGGNLIDGTFPNNGVTPSCLAPPANVTTTAISTYLPSAKIGNGNCALSFKFQ